MHNVMCLWNQVLVDHEDCTPGPAHVRILQVFQVRRRAPRRRDNDAQDCTGSRLHNQPICLLYERNY